KEGRHPISEEIIDPDPDRKYAYVFLKNETFQYPELWKKKKPHEELVQEEKRMANLSNKQANITAHRPGLTNWFR
ncbi:unnamed protein product, partial [Didymodactylos carnosus]